MLRCLLWTIALLVLGCGGSSSAPVDGGVPVDAAAPPVDGFRPDAPSPADSGLDAGPPRCGSAADCTDPARPACDETSGECVVCTTDDLGACAASERCEAGACVEIDECDPNPCQNGGVCTDGPSSFSCTCPTGFVGTQCETNVDECEPDPCLNGGTCMDGVASFTCTCPSGFMGERCETNVDDCAAGPCAHGNCVDGVDSYSCVCDDGWYGANCDTDCDLVAGPCLDVVSCAQADGAPLACAGCLAGRYGPVCESSCASPSGCTGTTTCAQADGAPISCEACEAGRYGPVCESSCVPLPTCAGTTSCDRVSGAATGCDACAAGWSGPLCATGPRSCRELLLSGTSTDGTFLIDPDGDPATAPVSVFCDMTNGGYTFSIGGTVENSPASVLGAGVCPAGMEAFAASSARALDVLERFVTSSGSAGEFYYANVFAGPGTACPALAPQIGYLSGGTWVDIGVDEGGRAPLDISGNCNDGVFDPIPMDSTNGLVNRGAPTHIFASHEVLQTGRVICSVNDRSRCSAVHFDGIDDLLIAPPSATYDAPASYTVEAWVWVERTPSFWAVIAAHHLEAATAQGAYGLYLTSGGRLYIDAEVGSSYVGATSAATVPLGRWVHVAGVFDSAAMRLTVFIDGVPNGTYATSFSMVNQRPGVPFTVGRLPDASSTHQPFPGFVDEVRVSRVARYSASFQPAESFAADADTAVLFHFDEGSGSIAADSAGGITATLEHGAAFGSPTCP